MPEPSCQFCGSGIIRDCVRCGAPQCCPRCCKALADELLDAMARDTAPPEVRINREENA